MKASARILAAGPATETSAPAQVVVSALTEMISEMSLGCEIATGICPFAGPDMLAALAGAELGVVLDSVPCEEHSCLRRFADLDDFEAIHALSAHGIALGEILELGEALGDRPRTLWVYGVGFDPARGGKLPPEDVQRHAAEILADVRSFLGR